MVANRLNLYFHLGSYFYKLFHFNLFKLEANLHNKQACCKKPAYFLLKFVNCSKLVFAPAFSSTILDVSVVFFLFVYFLSMEFFFIKILTTSIASDSLETRVNWSLEKCNRGCRCLFRALLIKNLVAAVEEKSDARPLSRLFRVVISYETGQKHPPGIKVAGGSLKNMCIPRARFKCKCDGVFIKCAVLFAPSAPLLFRLIYLFFSSFLFICFGLFYLLFGPQWNRGRKKQRGVFYAP